MDHLTDHSSRSRNPSEFVTDRDMFLFLLEEITRNLRRSFDARFEYAGLNRTQWRLLAYLLKDDGMTQTELSRCLEIERATVGQTVDKLEQQGLVERRASDRDRRVWHVHTLPKAQALVPELRVHADMIYDTMLGGIDTDQLSIARGILEQMARNVARLGGE